MSRFFFSISLISLLLGILFFYLEIPGGRTLMVFGVFFQLVFIAYWTTSSIKKGQRKNAIFQMLFLLLAITLLDKYQNWGYFDYLGIIVIPFSFTLIAINFIFSLKNEQNSELFQNKKLMILAGLYFILSIPVLASISSWPEPIIPTRWYDRLYKTIPVSTTDTTYSFQFKETYELYLKCKDLPKYTAPKEFLAAKKIEPYNPLVYYSLALLLENANLLEDAILEYDTAVVLDSTYSEAYGNRGVIYLTLGQLEESLSDHRKAIKFDSLNPIHYNNIALTLFQLGQKDEGCQYLDKAWNLTKIEEDENIRITIEKNKNRFCL